jgi:hypothetical protein
MSKVRLGIRIGGAPQYLLKNSIWSIDQIIIALPLFAPYPRAHRTGFRIHFAPAGQRTLRRRSGLGQAANDNSSLS